MGGELLRIYSFLFILLVKIRALRPQELNPAVISLGGALTGRTTSIPHQSHAPMRETIGVGSRVAARRGPSQDPKHGKVRQQRALKFGRVAESVDFNEWRVLWNDGAASTEKSNCLKPQPNNAALLPQVCTRDLFHPLEY
jgi:hypothetical protein